MTAYRKDKKGDLWLGGQGARLTPYQKKRIRAFCLDRDGSKCMLCTRKEEDLSKLQIDHIDGDSGNHRASNLQLAHQSCNSRAYHDLRSSQAKNDTLPYHTQRKRTMPTPQTMAPASVEVRLNKEYEPYFRSKCFEFVKDLWSKGEQINRNDLRKMVRELTGCGLGASYSYMERLFAPFIGPLKEESDAINGLPFVRFRFNTDLNLSLDDLESKFPKGGQRFKKDVDNK